jgi:ribonuclease-3
MDAEESLVGHRFKDRPLLTLALTHSSCGSENNESLACIGDRIYNVWVARRLHAVMPRAAKGELTDAINRTINRDVQYAVLVATGLDGFVRVGPSIVGSYGGVTTKMGATALEAVVAALEIDGGRRAAERFLARVLGSTIRARRDEHRERWGLSPRRALAGTV